MTSTKKLQSLQISLKKKQHLNMNCITEYNELKRDKELFELLQNTYTFIDKTNKGQLLYHLRDNLSQQLCLCGKQRKFHKYDKGYFKTCNDKECISKERLQSIKETTIEKYGVEHTSQLQSTKDKQKETMLNKYGTTHSFSGNLREKTYDANVEKYGVKHVLQREDSQEKRTKSLLDKFGTLDMLHSDKAKETNLEKYGVENAMKSKEISIKVSNSLKKTFIDRQIQKLIKWNIIIEKYDSEKQYYHIKCIKCNSNIVVAGTTMNSKLRSEVDPCTVCNPYIPSYVSRKEIEVSEYIKLLGFNIQTNVKTILKNSELDIFIQDKNIGFEFNGIYWHDERHKEQDYHKHKTKNFLEKNIQIYHIWEDDWNFHNEIVKSRICSILGKTSKLDARKCKIRLLDNKTSREFFETTHLDGNVNSKIAIGAYFNDELVSCMSFSKSRFENVENQWELLRFSNKLFTNVRGIASKILSFFIKEYSPKAIISYAKIDWTPDNEKSVYNALNFILESETPPAVYWVIDGIRINRLNFTKQKLIDQGFDNEKTAIEIMHERKYYRAFDTGNWKFKLNL